MRNGSRLLATNICGGLTIIYLCSFGLWLTVVSNPFGGNLHFPGGLRGGTATMLAAIVTSIVTGVLGRNTWWAVCAVAVCTFIVIV